MDFIHAQWAIRKWLADFIGSSVPIYEERAQGSFQRPSYRIIEASNMLSRIGGEHSVGIDNITVNVVYHSTGYNDMLLVESQLKDKLVHKMYIDGYLRNFEYPTPFLSLVDDVGSVIGGSTIFISTTGLKDPDETLGEETSIVVPVDNSVLVRVNRWPLSKPFFPEYNIYVNNQADTPKFHSKVSQISAGWSETVISTLGTGAAKPTSSELKFSVLKIQDINTLRMEDPIKNGVWDLTFQLIINSTNIPKRKQEEATFKNLTIEKVVSSG